MLMWENSVSFFPPELFPPFISSFTLLFLGSDSHSCVKLYYKVGTNAYYMSSELAGPMSSGLFVALNNPFTQRKDSYSSYPIDGALSNSEFQWQFAKNRGYALCKICVCEKLLASFCWKLDLNSGPLCIWFYKANTLPLSSPAPAPSLVVLNLF